MAQYGFYFNSEHCVGCRACQIACKDKNDLDVGILFRRVRSYETGAFPTPGYFHISSSCNHCAVPACAASCPVQALVKDPETGVVLVDEELCIGCKYCIDACPYTVPQYDTEKEVAVKCDFCTAWVAAGEQPACVEACTQRVIEWGDIEELKAKHPDAVMDLPCLPGSEMTTPSRIITPRAAATETNFREKFI